MRSFINPSIQEVLPSSIRVMFDEVARLQAQGNHITRLDIGSPNFAPPDFILDRVKANITNGFYTYSSNWGVIELRNALSDKYFKRAGIRFDAENEIIVTNGASEAVAMVIASLLEGEESFLIPTPAWPHYIADCQILEKSYKEIPCKYEDGFKLTPKLLNGSISKNTRVLLLNSPVNPTGAVYSREEFLSLVEICIANNILIVLDEIYEDINFEFTGTLLDSSIPKSNIIYINGFSKNYGMTGFRIGYLMANSQLSKQLIKYHQFTNVCGQQFAQLACAEFLQSQKRIEDYRDQILNTLKPSQEILRHFATIGRMHMTEPLGAFYSFARIPENENDAESFSMRLLKEKGVSVVAGSAFGKNLDRYVRLSYGSVGPEALQMALETMSEFYP